MQTYHTEKLRRFLTMFLAFAICISVLSAFCTAKANAANVLTYDTLDSIKEDINVFGTIESGKISAKKINGVWYYQFTRSGYDTVRIKATAFSTQPKNTYLDEDNKAINAAFKENAFAERTRTCYYNKMTSVIKTTPAPTTTLETYTEYTTSMYRFLLTVDAKATADVVLRATLTRGVKFTYSSKVRASQNSFPSAYGTYYVEPTTASGYMAALSRSSSVAPITPVITLQADNSSKNTNLWLANYELTGLGAADTSLDINTLIKIGEAACGAVVGQNAIAAAIFLKELGAASAYLEKGSKDREYNTVDERIGLSPNDDYALSAEFTSPIELSYTSSDDMVQITVKLGWGRGKYCSADESRSNVVFLTNFSFK